MWHRGASLAHTSPAVTSPAASPVVPTRARRRSRRQPGGLARPRAAAVLGRHSRLFNSNGSLAQALEVCTVQTAPQAVVVEGFALCGINDYFFMD